MFSNTTSDDVEQSDGWVPEIPHRRAVRANEEEHPGEFIREIPKPRDGSAYKLANELVKKNRSKGRIFLQRQSY